MLLAAQTAAEGQGGILGTLGSFLPIILMFVVFYFVLIRPQRKKEKETQEMLASLKAGDNVTTIGGICGKIVSVKDDILTVEVGADKVKLVFERWAIRDVERPEEESEESD
ncbi:MAG: preprotein translocase subunit YajC [Clostridiales bacterium]|jgi:preprotein translocase subunit YajC|nr:preprotein translocase subunit YajC [Clostridiales bacterium]